MKRYLKPYLLILVFSLFGSFAFAGAPKPACEDTISIKFVKEGAKVFVSVESTKDAEIFKVVKIETLVEEIKILSDSANSTGKTVIQKKAEYSLVIEPNSSQVMLVTDLDEKKDPDEEPYRRRTSESFNFDFGINNYSSYGGNAPDAYLLNTWHSNTMAISKNFRTRLGEKDSDVYFRYGIELSKNIYRFQSNSYLTETGEAKAFNSDSLKVKKSKFSTIYLNIPIMMEYTTENFSIALGGYVGYRLGSYSKMVYTDNGETHKSVNHNDFDLNNWRYGVRLELGFDDLRVFATYDVNNLFTQQSLAPKLNSYSFGVCF